MSLMLRSIHTNVEVNVPMFFMNYAAVEEGGSDSLGMGLVEDLHSIFMQEVALGHTMAFLCLWGRRETDRFRACSCGLAFCSSPSSNNMSQDFPSRTEGTYRSLFQISSSHKRAHPPEVPERYSQTLFGSIRISQDVTAGEDPEGLENRTNLHRTNQETRLLFSENELNNRHCGRASSSIGDDCEFYKSWIYWSSACCYCNRLSNNCNSFSIDTTLYQTFSNQAFAP